MDNNINENLELQDVNHSIPLFRSTNQVRVLIEDDNLDEEMDDPYAVFVPQLDTSPSALINAGVVPQSDIVYSGDVVLQDMDLMNVRNKINKSVNEQEYYKEVVSDGVKTLKAKKEKVKLLDKDINSDNKDN